MNYPLDRMETWTGEIKDEVWLVDIAGINRAIDSGELDVQPEPVFASPQCLNAIMSERDPDAEHVKRLIEANQPHMIPRPTLWLDFEESTAEGIPIASMIDGIHRFLANAIMGHVDQQSYRVTRRQIEPWIQVVPLTGADVRALYGLHEKPPGN